MCVNFKTKFLTLSNLQKPKKAKKSENEKGYKMKVIKLYENTKNLQWASWE